MFYVKILIFNEIYKYSEKLLSLIFRVLSLNLYARYYRSFKYCDQVFPVYLIHCHIVLTLYFHELVPLNEGLLMKVVGITLIVYHTDLALVFRHEHVNITIQWITMVSTTDYLTYTLSLASHVVKFRKIIEVMQSVYT